MDASARAQQYEVTLLALVFDPDRLDGLSAYTMVIWERRFVTGDEPLPC